MSHLVHSDSHTTAHYLSAQEVQCKQLPVLCIRAGFFLDLILVLVGVGKTCFKHRIITGLLID